MQRTAQTAGPRRTSWLIAVAVVATAVAWAVALNIQAQGIPVVDMTGEVTRDSCSPCHMRLDEADTPGLIYSHGTHILVACSSCHATMPHEAGQTARPGMAGCFACHGVPHSAGPVLGSGECETCHTPAFDLRPASHVDDWAQEPHVRGVESDGTNSCMLCHVAPIDCDACHVEQAVEVGPMPPLYIASVPVRPERPEWKISLGGPVTPGQCIFCHYDFDDFEPGRIIFYHEDHLSRGFGCTGCHPVFPHTPEGTIYNTMADCYRCHSLEHAGQGLVATEECLDCHPPSFELVPENHTPEFTAREHAGMVEEDETYCTLCHKSPFCQECHRAQRVMADGSEARFVIPEDHQEAVWLSQHGPKFLDATGTCWACHDSPSCERCHQTPMPHPPGWFEEHGLSEFSKAADADCDVCHTDRQWCQECHHDQVRRVDLVEENCTPCHEEMATFPRTQLRDQKLAPHAVHFEVQEVKGRPYRCYECHATWGSNGNGNATDHVGSPSELGHDLRLCYDCHGALDFQSVLIAPWPGAQLCGRCHPEGPVSDLDPAAQLQ
ncbi:MAG: hypothetical protein RQ731_07820 [Anaerosomatales bacterium]|nr:hypothetical protein [Anaerosomatales bacterium]MDT8434644.1 hypothetical protein [Anaerosomatales bacterium]